VLGIVYTAQVDSRRAWAYVGSVGIYVCTGNRSGLCQLWREMRRAWPPFDAPDPPYARINASRRAEAV
jgi:hypothetical protein